LITLQSEVYRDYIDKDQSKVLWKRNWISMKLESKSCPESLQLCIVGRTPVRTLVDIAGLL
jgi:hypothetical protein